jgi:hypothetical protein
LANGVEKLKVWAAVIVRDNGIKRPIFAAREANAIPAGLHSIQGAAGKDALLPPLGVSARQSATDQGLRCPLYKPCRKEYGTGNFGSAAVS